MKVKHMTETQLLRIIANNYLGEHNRKGKQFDYVDYQHEINCRLWELQDSKLSNRLSNQSKYIEPIDMSFLESDRLIDPLELNKIFNKWRYIGSKLMWGL